MDNQINPHATLYKKLALVMGDMKGGIEKRGRNTQQNYDYTTAEDVKSLARQAMVRHGVAFWVAINSAEQATGQTGKGAAYTDTRLDLTFTLACTDTGASIAIPWRSEARDYADKGLNKAVTAAVKYFLLATFLPSTSDEPDAAAETIEGKWVYTCDVCGEEVADAAAKRVSEATGGQVLCKQHYSAWRKEQEAGK